MGEPHPGLKTVYVASGTGTVGIKQVNINLTGPTGPTINQWPNWLSGSGSYPGNLPIVQNVGVQGPYPNVVMTNYSGSVSNDPATTVLLAAMNVQPTAAQITNINTMIVGLKAAGIWSQLDALWVPGAVSTQQAANLNWINPSGGPTLLPNTSDVATLGPLFEPNRGYIGDSGKVFINTQFKPSVNGVNFTQNNASMWAYTLRNFQEASSMGTDPTPRALLRPYNASNQFIFGCNDGTLSTITAGGTVGNGFFGVQRIDSGHVLGWKNGAQVGTTQAVASTGPVVNNIYFCGEDSTTNTGNQYALVAVGASLAGLEASFNTVVAAFISAAITNVKWNGSGPVWTQSGEGFLRTWATGSTGPSTLAYERTQAWSMNCVAQIFQLPATAGILFTNVTTTPKFPGYEAWLGPTGSMQVRIISDITAPNYIGVSDNTNWCDGKYHIFGVTYDGSSTAAGVKIYVDGAQQSTSVLSDTLSTSIVSGNQDFTLGNQINHYDFGLYGNMAFFALSNVVRSSAYMTAFVSPATLPAEDASHSLYYGFTEGTGFNTQDTSSNGFTGTFCAGIGTAVGAGTPFYWK